MAPGRQLGGVWGGVAAALIALSPLAPRLAVALPACPLKTFTGLPCPTCGATRAALALARFDLAGALAVSPLATLGWLGLVGGGLLAGGWALSGRALPAAPAVLPVWARVAAIAALAANWAYLVWAGI